ncbi:MAG TPA: DUF6282 family protein [Candidatus Limnocylindria bacterium]|jgi:hypothetical protein|nr:DUF6282 family protein [Candidatus Limnocylindria bacterium]
MSETCAQACLGIAAAETFVDPPLAPDLVHGYVDLHVHTSPDVFGRALDDDEAAQAARRAGMGGLVLKNHAAETASRAELLARRHRVEAWGGVVLNRAVGGVNADAADAMARVEGGRGRVVWLPTIDAGNHRRFLGIGDDGLEVVAHGRPTPDLERVVRVCAERDLALCTGHTGADDALVVAELAGARGVRCCITHGLFPIVGLTEAHVRRAAELGAVVELCAIGTLMGPNAHLPWMRAWGTVDTETCARYVATFGADAFLVSSDLGSSGNPVPADGIRRFVAALAALGISRAELDALGRDAPRRLLGVGAP